MIDYQADKLRNITVLGHSGAGKTTVLESMLVFTGELERIGKASEGTSALDIDKEEIRRGQSVYLKLSPIEWKSCKINFIDTPGYLDFFGETVEGLQMGDNALVIVDAKEGVEAMTEKSMQMIDERKLPTIFFINKMDDEHASFDRTYSQLRETFGKTVIAFEYPIFEKDVMVGSVNVLKKKAWYFNNRETAQPVPEHLVAEVEACYEQIKEAVALSDELLMEKYFEGESFSEDEITKGVCFGVRQGEIKPVYSGSAEQMTGVERLLDLIVEYFPSYAEKKTIETHDVSGHAVTLKTSEDEVFTAQVYKTVIDPFVGRISYLKVLTGVLPTDTTVYNANKDQTEKVTQIYAIRGKYQSGIGKLFTGDIGAVVKLQVTQTNDTLTQSKDYRYVYNPVHMPVPLLGVAIWPKTKADEDKMSQSFQKLMEEDLSARTEKNVETNEFILYGLGDQHIDVLLNRANNKYKVNMNTTEPRVPYRETIQKTVEAEGRHKKQSGGAGQFGHVFIRFEPSDEEEMVFESKVVGGAVPKQFYPAVEVGLRECMHRGVLAGYKVVGIKATLFDGKYHDVDSKEVAFKAAARLAYKAGMPKAHPVILEPIVNLEIIVPEEYVGSVIGDINKRRGIILGMDSISEKLQVISAEAPMAEVMTYSNELRSITQGRGEYTQVFDRYEVAPQMVADRVISQADLQEVEED